MNQKLLQKFISIGLAMFLVGCGTPVASSTPIAPTFAPTLATEFQADFKNVTRLNTITAGGQKSTVRPGQTFVLVEFEVSGCDSTSTFFFGVTPEGYIVNKDFSGLVLSNVFCDNVKALTITDSQGKHYYPVGFVSYSTVIFEVEEIAEGLSLQINDGASIPLP
jgi:hypothetical protein